MTFPQSPGHAEPRPNDPLLLTIPEVAQRLRRGRSTVYAEIADGKLKTLKLRGGTFVRPADLQDYLDNLPAGRGAR